MTESASETRARARRAAWTWGSLILGLLVLQVVLCAVGIYKATVSNKVVVEHDYYNKALHWDDHMALERESKSLGWTTQLVVGEPAGNGNRRVTFTVVGGDGKAVADAQVRVVYFHHADPAAMHDVTLPATDPGLYAASVPMPRPGLWEFRFDVRRGQQQYVRTLVQKVEDKAADKVASTSR